MTATVVLGTKPVPCKVTWLAVPIGPAFGDMPVSVGAGGLAMVTLIALDVDGVVPGVSTVIEAVPAEVRSAAGTVVLSPVQ